MANSVSCFQAPKPDGAPAFRPRSARVVAKVRWSWGPANGRSDKYFLSTDRNRTRWYLWLYDPSEPGYEINEIVAYCPYSSTTREMAAAELLATFFRDDHLNREIGVPTEVYDGMLSVDQIMSIARATLSEE